METADEEMLSQLKGWKQLASVLHKFTETKVFEDTVVRLVNAVSQIAQLYSSADGVS